MAKKDETPKKKKTTKKKTDGRKKSVDEPLGQDFADIANEVKQNKNKKDLVPVDKAKKIALQKYQELLLENGKDLEPIEIFVCEQLALGKLPEAISSSYNVPLNQIMVMMQNPIFIQ